MVFVDASAWVALFDSRDEHHEEAKEYWHLLIEELDLPISTSNWTVYEAYTVVKSHAGYRQMIELKNLLDWTTISVTTVTDEDEQDALRVFTDRAYRNKGWSVVDCANVVLAGRIGCEEFFAFNPRDYPQLCGLYGLKVAP
ncbi:MAG: type II toxin-antitoxin system VapC family toxin [Dehalococcoidia bacterium]